jgi:hypothetical protein
VSLENVAGKCGRPDHSSGIAQGRGDNFQRRNGCGQGMLANMRLDFTDEFWKPFNYPAAKN